MKPTYSFYARVNRKNKRGLVPVFLRVTYNRKIKYINSGIRIEEKHWNVSKEIVRKSHQAHKRYNNELSLLKLKAENIGFELEKKNGLSADKIGERLIGKKPVNIVTFTRGYIQDLKTTGSVRRSKQTLVILNKIIAFSKSEEVEFSDITADYLNKLQYYMQTEYKNHPNTIRKDFERLKMVFASADDKQMINENVFLRYKLPTRQKTKKEALTFEQIKKIDSLTLVEGSRHFHVKNYFMFSFYNAGIRFGDLCKLKWENIEDGRLKYLMSKSQKNKAPKWKNIKLSDQSYDILKHYQGKGTDRDYIFPILDPKKDNDGPVFFDAEKSRKNALVNASLKIIAKKADISLSISFHIARHSFARHAANMGMNIYAISNALAHSDLKTTQTYLSDFNESLLDKEMSSIF